MGMLFASVSHDQGRLAPYATREQLFLAPDHPMGRHPSGFVDGLRSSRTAFSSGVQIFASFVPWPAASAHRKQSLRCLVGRFYWTLVPYESAECSITALYLSRRSTPIQN